MEKISGELVLNLSSIVNVIAASSDYVILLLLKKIINFNLDFLKLKGSSWLTKIQSHRKNNLSVHRSC